MDIAGDAQFLVRGDGDVIRSWLARRGIPSRTRGGERSWWLAAVLLDANARIIAREPFPFEQALIELAAVTDEVFLVAESLHPAPLTVHDGAVVELVAEFEELPWDEIVPDADRQVLILPGDATPEAKTLANIVQKPVATLVTDGWTLFPEYPIEVASAVLDDEGVPIALSLGVRGDDVQFGAYCDNERAWQSWNTQVELCIPEGLAPGDAEQARAALDRHLTCDDLTSMGLRFIEPDLASGVLAADSGNVGAVADALCRSLGLPDLVCAYLLGGADLASHPDAVLVHPERNVGDLRSGVVGYLRQRESRVPIWRRRVKAVVGLLLVVGVVIASMTYLPAVMTAPDQAWWRNLRLIVAAGTFAVLGVALMAIWWISRDVEYVPLRLPSGVVRQPRSMGVMRYFLIAVLALVGVVFSVLGLYGVIEIAPIYLNGDRSTATVVSITDQGKAVVDYVVGVRVVSATIDAPGSEVGDRIPIVYERSRPEHAVSQRDVDDPRSAGLVGFFLVGGIGMLGAALYMSFGRGRRRTRQRA